jgi:hypothetical protein
MASSAKETRITYPISPEYVTAWSIERALSEVVANALDEDDTPTLKWEDGVFTIEDSAPNGIPEYGLILGRSDKNAKQIGQFGEGLKIACLVLARARSIKSMTVESVGYTLTPSIVKEALLPGSKERHEMLSYLVTPNTRSSGTLVTVNGVSEETAEKVKARFRSITDSTYTPPTGAGELLVDAPGKIFIGGVLVQERKNLLFGYDLSLDGHKSLQNRDRTVIDGYALKHSLSRIIQEASDADVLEKLVRAALDGTLDPIERHFPHSPSPTYRKAISEVRKRVYGEKKIAYKDRSANDEHLLDLKDRGWIIPEAKIDEHHHQAMMRLLGAETVSIIARNANKQPRVVTDWVKTEKLDASERETLEAAVNIVRSLYGPEAVGEVQAYNETRYEKADEALHFGGFYQAASKDGKIGLHRKNLHSLQQTLEVLIHESAHRILHRSHKEYEDRTRSFEGQLGDMAATLALRLYELGAVETFAATEQAKSDKVEAERAEKLVRVPGLAARTLCAQKLEKKGFKTIKAFREEAGLTQTMATALVSTKGRGPNTVPGLEQVEAGCKLLGLDPATIWLCLFSQAICTYKRNNDGKLYGGSHWAAAGKALAILHARGGRASEIATEIEKQLSGETPTDAEGFEGVYRWNAKPTGNEKWLDPYRELLEMEKVRLGPPLALAG